MQRYRIRRSYIFNKKACTLPKPMLYQFYLSIANSAMKLPKLYLVFFIALTVFAFDSEIYFGDLPCEQIPVSLHVPTYVFCCHVRRRGGIANVSKHRTRLVEKPRLNPLLENSLAVPEQFIIHRHYPLLHIHKAQISPPIGITGTSTTSTIFIAKNLRRLRSS